MSYPEESFQAQRAASFLSTGNPSPGPLPADLPAQQPHSHPEASWSLGVEGRPGGVPSLPHGGKLRTGRLPYSGTSLHTVLEPSYDHLKQKAFSNNPDLNTIRQICLWVCCETYEPYLTPRETCILCNGNWSLSKKKSNNNTMPRKQGL